LIGASSSKRGRDEEGGRPQRGSYAKRGRGNGGRRGGGSKKPQREEYEDLITTRDKGKSKINEADLEKVQLCSNHFKVSCKSKEIVKMYTVDFSPRIPHGDRRTAGNLIKKLPLGTLIFDGRSSMYTATNFEKSEFTMNAHDSKTNTEYSIRFRKTNHEIFFTDGQFLSVLGLMVKNCNENIGMITVGKNFYDPNEIVDIREYKIRILFGNKTSMRQHEEQILLNVAPACKV
jgi:N-terminal domain of argonaute